MTHEARPKQSEVISCETISPKYNSGCLSSFIFYSGTTKKRQQQLKMKGDCNKEEDNA